ncbi:MAG: DUF2029 domain-containing protein [Planctomycetes bacterium]|nr:DUF2029 domain-containing protein [Planctomycetota bacterium]
MVALNTGRFARWRGWLPLAVGGAVYTVILCVIVVERAESTTDFRDFWQTASHFRQTGQITADKGVHNYLPFFTIFMLPWSFLPLRAAIVVFTLLSMGLLAVTVVMVEILLNQRLDRRPRGATYAALGLMFAYVHSCGVLGAAGLLLLFLIVATWFLVERGREWEAGLPLGFAALIKLLPLVLIVFFLLKRRWRVAATSLGVFVVLGMGLPLVMLGLDETIAQHREFRRRAVEEHSAYTTIFAAQPRKAKYNNNALPIVLRRLLSPVNADPDEERPGFFVNVATLPPPVIWSIYLVIVAGALGATALVTLQRPRGWPPESLEDIFEVRAQYGQWCCLMLIATPLMWTHYLPLVYWPLALLADRVERTRRAARRPCRLSYAALVLWLIGVLLLAWPPARAAGAQQWSVVVLWLAALWLSVGRRRGP